MIPSLVAGEIRETLLDYLKTTWSLADQDLERALLEFLAGPNGLFKGPYLRLALPFERASDEAPIPLDIPNPYTPYRHQLEAWQRLSTQGGRTPDPTLVVTGTGSGKTEAFVMPILDHCLRAKKAGEKGIKAIVLYPMNALASDQARRMAQMVWGDDEGEHPMRGEIRVGMYVGGQGNDEDEGRQMGGEHVITTAEELIDNPPDILLTNYRMLDFLLLRPKDRALWQHNDTDTLRYLVLDELHTYDGAQGTDVACLIRRLKARLGDTNLCPIGTSATVSSGHNDGHGPLLDFASKIFGLPFAADSVIGETRHSPEFFVGQFSEDTISQLPSNLSALQPQSQDSIESYVARVATAWFPGCDIKATSIDRVALSALAMRHTVARSLIAIASTGVQEMSVVQGKLVAAASELQTHTSEEQKLLLGSLLSMLSWCEESPGRPMLAVQVQLWVREVRRLVRTLGDNPSFLWREDQPEQDGDPLALPMYYCRSCGHSGWLTLVEELADGRVVSDVAKVGGGILKRSREVRYLHTDANAAEVELEGLQEHICPTCYQLCRDSTCKGCGGETMPVYVHCKLSKGTPPQDMQQCPCCGSDGELSILASRAASVASVAVGHLYSTPFNSDRKLLAFSDSVQDASHRAGFFSGRTYRLSLRRAMLAVIPAEGSVPLLSVASRMWEYWSEKHSKGDAMAAFLPRDLDYLDSYDRYMTELGFWNEEEQCGPEPMPSSLLERDLLARLSWEVNREFGVASRVGRTLERVGCASLGLDSDRFEEAMRQVTSHLPARLGVVTDVGEAAWRLFVSGLLQRLRLRGGVYDDLLQMYFEQGGNQSLLSKKFSRLLSPFGQYMAKPKFWSSDESSKFDSPCSNKARGWYADWCDRALGLQLPTRDSSDVYRELIPILSNAGILVEHKTGKRSFWGLDPRALTIGRQSQELRCGTCGYELAVPSGDAFDVSHAPCLRYRCDGMLVPSDDVPESRAHSYYKRFYERAALSRVWAAEHTGLLDRESREEVEIQFQKRYRSDAPNMLSCTPTLEMGIDIGDLSATLLMSVPPTPASYLQRIGRAGRKTGNALVLTITSSKPHDRYFFETPEEAMAGRVDPPGCYLDAPEILKRQALAFCMDRWTEVGDAIPLTQLRELMTDSAKFPEALFSFVDARRSMLTEGFLMHFELSDVSKRSLQTFMTGAGPGLSPMEQALTKLIREAKEEREDLRKLRTRLSTRIKQIDSGDVTVADPEEEKREFLRERGFVRAELKQLEEQYTLQFLCEGGLLPNYAFPEAGVRLKSFVSSSEAKPGKQKTTREEQTAVVRAARTAIKELAPFNHFYGNRIKVQIDSVKVGARAGKRSGDAVRTWQFCKECGHMEEVRLLDDEMDECPRCKAPDWRETGRQRKLVRLKEVSAYANDRDANFSDESEDRQRSYYVTQKFYDPSPGDAMYGRVDYKAPFGFELQSKLTLREVNFGQKDEQAESCRLGGETIDDVAFQVCTDCGQVINTSSEKKQESKRGGHRPWCKAKDKGVAPIHLFREIESEALLLLLPVALLETDVRLPNFAAALALGLRGFFGGDPNHLELGRYSEPTFTSEGARRQFLVVYDTVPGGTGVLAELAKDDGVKLRSVFEHAQAALSTCGCAEDENVKACYRCLYAHSRQFELAVLDRKIALEQVERILESFDRFEPVRGSLSEVPVAEALESELERRFWSCLENWSVKNGDTTWEPLDDGQARIRFANHAWCIEPQVVLGGDSDIQLECRPDFVLWPETEDATVRPIAIFTDGATHHVRPDSPIGNIADDFLKRSSLLDSQKFHVWSIGWQDVDWYLGDQTRKLPSWIYREAVRSDALMLASKLGTTFGDSTLRDVLAAGLSEDSLSLLLRYLANPKPTRWCTTATLLGASLLGTHHLMKTTEQLVESATKRILLDTRPKVVVGDQVSPGEHCLAVEKWGGNSGFVVVYAALADVGPALGEPERLKWILRLEDSSLCRANPSFVDVWRQFLRVHNLLQFLPALEVVTTEQLLEFPDEVNEEPATRSRRPSVIPVNADASLSEDVLAELHESEEEFWPVLEALASGGAAIPAIPYEHGDENEWEIHMGWSKQQVGVYLPGEEESAEVLRKLGWTLFAATDVTLVILRAELKE